MVEPSSDLSVAGWLVDSLLPFDTYAAGSVVPPGYQAYAHILHPARCRTGYVSWAEIAKWSEKVYHPAMQFEAIATPVPGSRTSPPPWDGQMPYGGMPPSQARALAGILRPFTGTSGIVWYLVWEGHGILHAPSALRLRRTARSYLLYGGGIDDAADLGIGTNRRVVADYWFPEDQAWCVATDVDLFWTYVGGSRTCVEEFWRARSWSACRRKSVTDSRSFPMRSTGFRLRRRRSGAPRKDAAGSGERADAQDKPCPSGSHPPGNGKGRALPPRVRAARHQDVRCSW